MWRGKGNEPEAEKRLGAHRIFSRTARRCVARAEGGGET